MGKTYFLSNRDAVSFKELAGLILRGMKKRALRVPTPDRVVRFLGDLADGYTKMTGRGGLFSRDKAIEMTQKSWVCSPARAKRDLGWEARIGPDEGFRETLEWYKSEKLV